MIVKCDNRDMADKPCGERMQRRHLTNHKKNKCKYRPYTCEYCGYKSTFEGIAIRYVCQGPLFSYEGPPHYEECKEYPLECPNKCGKNNIKRKDMKEHCDICPLEPLDCPFNAGDCSKNILRKDMESHKEICDYQPYSCVYCGHHGTIRDITGRRATSLFSYIFQPPRSSHYFNCDQYPLLCPNECDEIIKRGNMKGHRDFCPLEPLDCPFKDVGCTDKIQRKNMEKHIESNTHHHLMMVFKTHQESIETSQELIKELIKSNQELMKANRELRARVEKLEKK